VPAGSWWLILEYDTSRSLAMPRCRSRPRHVTPARRFGWLVLALVAWPSGPARADDWPQWLGPRRDGVWRETGVLERFPEGGPKTRWRTAIGAGYAGPAVAGDRVFVTDRVLATGAANPADPFARDAIAGRERVLCLDDATGKVLWTHEYDCPYRVSYPAGPRATPVVRDGKVYTLGTMGDLLCLDATDGKVLWSRNLPADYKAPVPVWGFSASPLLDGDRLICLVGGKGSVAVAFHKDTGKELWRALSADEPGYCPPVIVDAGGKRQLIIWHPQAVNSVDPESGHLWWSQQCRVNAGMSIATPRQAGDLLLVSSFYNGSIMLKLDADAPRARVLWRGKSSRETPRYTDGLHTVMSTPLIKDGYIYGVCSYGELRCLRADTGERVWKTMQATTGGPEERWANAFLVAQGDRFFLFNEKGDLIIARLTAAGYKEISRARVIEPTNRMVAGQREGQAAVVWSHPAFAHRAAYVRNDREIVCVSLAANGDPGE
jgi:outer membrane protein assembly factor BamB